LNGGKQCSGLTKDEVSCPDCAIFYEHGNYLGPSFNLNGDNNWVGDFNDKISSFRVKPGCTVLLHEHTNYEGDHLTKYNSDMSYVTSQWNDKASSVQCFCECPNKDWKMYKGSCYAYAKDSYKTWADAEAYCKTEPGAHLASIHNAEELQFVQSNFPRDLWFGASDIQEEGTFEWSDGSSWDYSAWRSGEPNNNGNQDCLVGNWEDLKWDDDDCEKKKMFLCKLG